MAGTVNQNQLTNPSRHESVLLITGTAAATGALDITTVAVAGQLKRITTYPPTAQAANFTVTITNRFSMQILTDAAVTKNAAKNLTIVNTNGLDWVAGPLTIAVSGMDNAGVLVMEIVIGG